MEIEFNWRESGFTRQRFQKDKNVPVNFKFFREKGKRSSPS